MARDLRIAGLTAAEPPALLQNAGSGSAVDGAVNTTSAKETRIGRIDDGISPQSFVMSPT
jgi:hypothetical protein